MLRYRLREGTVQYICFMRSKGRSKISVILGKGADNLATALVTHLSRQSKTTLLEVKAERKEVIEVSNRCCVRREWCLN